MRSTRTRMVRLVQAACVCCALALSTGCDKETAAESARSMERASGGGPNDWILFFEEGDALFGKRTQIQDSHDKYDDD